MNKKKKRIIVLLIIIFFISIQGNIDVFGQSKEEAVRLNNSGVQAYNEGKYREALDYFERSLEIYLRLKRLIDISSNLHNIGAVYNSLGQYEKALNYFEESLKISRKLKKPQDIAQSLHNIGGVYNSLGQLENALEIYKEELILRREQDNSDKTAICLSYIGNIYESLRQNEKALSSYKEALRIRLKKNIPIKGDIPKDIITSLIKIEKVYQSLGQTDKTIKFILIEAREEIKLEAEAIELFSSGVNAYKKGNYQESLSYVQRSLNIYKKIGSSKKEIASITSVAGLICSKLNQNEKALTYLEETLKIRRELNILHAISESLIHIGGVFKSLGKHEMALPYYEEALEVDRRQENFKKIAKDLDNIGDIYYSLGQYKKSLLLYEEAYMIKIKKGIGSGFLKSIGNISVAYDALGQEKSFKYITDNAVKRIESENKANKLYIQGRNAFLKGNREEAISLFKSSVEICRSIDYAKGISANMIYLGEIYFSIGLYEKALLFFKEALKLFREQKMSKEVAICLNSIGFFYYNLGQYEQALIQHEESLEIRRSLNIPQDIRTSLTNLGFVYMAQKKYDEAEQNFFEARKIKTENSRNKSIISSSMIQEIYKNKSALTMEDLLLSTKMNQTGMVEYYLTIRKFQKAITLLKEMTPAWDSSDSQHILFHTQKGLALKGRKMFQEASHEFFRAVSISDEMRERIKERAGFYGAGYGRGRIRSYRGLVSTLSERAIIGEKKDEIFVPYGQDISSCALYFAESTKARVLLEVMAESEKKKRKIELPETMQNKEQNLIIQLSAIEFQWEETYQKGEEAFKELQERKKKLNAELNSLIKELRKTHPQYAALYYPKPIPPEELPLKDNEVLIEYAVCDDASYVFVVRKGGVEGLIKIPLGRDALEEKVKAFMMPLNTNQYQDFSIKIANELYDILLSKVLKEVKENEKIIIIPDGILGLLPFEALVLKARTDVKDSIYVGDKYSLSYYQSATVMAFQRRFKSKKTEKTIFALGNPVFSEKDERYIAFKRGKQMPSFFTEDIDHYAYRALASRREWGKTLQDDAEGKEIAYIPLPETEAEVKWIAKSLDVKPEPPDILLNLMANETEFRKVELDKYRYIHFATHADLSGRVQGIQEPFLLLGQVENERKDDGFLTMSEVLGLKLNADLVVLSACVTGVGKQMEGEGVANFARAFQYAGAKSVIVSLWELASKEAVEYMEIFYGHLKEGKTRSEALSLARQEIKTKYPNPFYWAVFILHGEG